ncbi:MAG: CotH kinase family protein [Burkholderiales bacterium]
MRALFPAFLIASCGLLASPVAGAASTAIEYYHSGDGNYCVASSPKETAALDAGVISGWTRTGERFGVLDLGAAGSASVYRFWSGQTFAPASSHFYTPIAAECAAVLKNPDWTFEGEVFALTLADAAGTCPGDTLPLYRLYNDGRSGVPNHRYTTSAAIRSLMLAQGWVAEGAGLGVIGCVPPVVEPQLVKGRVVDGYVELALVCADLNRNGRCDGNEPQAYSDAAGAYQIAVPPDAAPAPLVAEVIAGRSRDGDAPQSTVDASFRMASPGPAYGTDITPFSTLVLLTGQSDYRLAEDLVRGTLGLPPYYDIKLSAPAAAGSLKQSVAKAVVTALKASGMGLDLAAPTALATVIAAFPAALTDVPQLRIATKDRAPIVSKEDYVDATYVLTNPAAAVPTVNLNGKIRGRGHSTWGQPKNPYKVQFTNDASYAAISDVLGMRKQRNWALLADYFDRSLIRNKLALSLGGSSVFTNGLKWTPAGQHVEVWLNDDYVGVYLLTEDIRIDAARLNLKKMGAADVDGGYIVEVDSRLDCYNGTDFSLQLVTALAVPFCIDTPDESAITPNQLAYIKNLLSTVEADLYGPRKLQGINQASYADWYLLQEFVRNNDALFISSDYMWKDAATAADPKDRLLNMGPLWDFDRSIGNVNYFDNWMSSGCWVSKPYLPNWLSRLLDNRDFLALTLARWKQKRPALEAFVNASIDTFARRLGAAQKRNFDRWPIFDVPLTNYYVFANHAEEVAFVRRFLNERMAWLDAAYASPQAFDLLCK